MKRFILFLLFVGIISFQLFSENTNQNQQTKFEKEKTATVLPHTTALYPISFNGIIFMYALTIREYNYTDNVQILITSTTSISQTTQIDSSGEVTIALASPLVGTYHNLTL